ncbi:uncharacterized protein METZ01_LOCUS7644 [marine metagenome]|uniref:Uncharacterized protein n=1 Tax=marine metagenome TaxID=408172 RepID=A0A381NJR1_9ZZZZ
MRRRSQVVIALERSGVFAKELGFLVRIDWVLANVIIGCTFSPVS